MTTISTTVNLTSALSGAIIVDGGLLNVRKGGTAISTTVSSGGSDTVSSGGMAIATTISSGGFEEAFSSGLVVSTTLDAGGTQFVAAGGTASGTIMGSNTVQDLFEGGAASFAIGTIINSGAVENDYGSAVSTTISGAGALQNVIDGGAATSTTISDGGIQDINSGSTAAVTSITSGGTQEVGFDATFDDDATVTGTTVFSGGSQLIVAGSAVSTTIESGGFMGANTGATVTGVVIDGGTLALGASFGSDALTFEGAGGVAVLATGDSALANMISGLSAGDGLWFQATRQDGETSIPFTAGDSATLAGTTLSANLSGMTYTFNLANQSYAGLSFDAIPVPIGNVLTAGFATGIEVVSASAVTAGSTASNTTLGLGQAQRDLGDTVSITVGSGAEQDVTGSANATTIDSGGVQLVSAGGTAIGGNVSGIEYIFAGGSDSGATVGSGGAQQVNGVAISTGLVGDQYVAGVASATTISVGGQQTVFSGGTAVGTMDDWYQQVDNGGFAVGDTINSGGSNQVYGIAANTTVASGGEEEVMNGGTAVGATVDSGGSQIVFGTDVDVVIAGGMLEVGEGGAFSGSISFAGAGGSLVIGEDTFTGAQLPTPSATTISGFTFGDSVDLPGVGFGSGDVWNFAANVLTLSAGGSTYSLTFGSIAPGGSFHLAPDGLVDPATGDIGTLINYDQITSVPVGMTDSNGLIPLGTAQIVSGTALDDTIAAGGEQDIWGSASGTTVAGLQVVFGSANGSRIASGGRQFVASGAMASATTVSDGGLQDVYGTANGTTIKDGGSAYIGLGGSAIGAVISGDGTLEIANAGALGSGTSLTFAGTGGFLQIDSPPDSAMPGAVISGFAPGDAIGLADVENFEPSVTWLGDNVLQVSIDFNNYDFNFDPTQDFGNDQFEVVDFAPDGEPFAFDSEIILSAGPGPTISSGATAISDGVTSTNVTVTGSGIFEVLSGGTTYTTTVSSGGEQYIGSGGTSFGTQVQGGGADVVFGTDSDATLSGTSAATATQYDFGVALGGTTFSNGFQQVALAGAIASGMTIEYGGEQYVGSGGTTLAAQVESGGAEVVFGFDSGASVSGTQYDYGTASGGTTYNNGEQLVASGATAISMTVESGGQQYIGSGGTAIATNIASQGAQVVFGSALGALVSGTEYDFNYASGGTTYNNGFQLVAPGAFAIGMTVESGGEQYIGAGGTALSTDIASQGAEVIFGTDSGALVSGTQYVFGVASGGTTFDGGYQLVAPAGAGTAIGMTVSSLGVQYVVGGGTAMGTQIMSQGAEIVHGTDWGATISGTQYVFGLASGTVAATGGYQLVSAGGTISAASISGGTIELMSGAADGTAPISFTGAGQLLLDASTSFSGTVANFGSASLADTIDFADITYVASGSAGATTVGWNQLASGADPSGTLVVSQGGHTADITLLGQYSVGNFTASSDGHGGTLITDPSAPTVADSSPLALVTRHT